MKQHLNFDWEFHLENDESHVSKVNIPHTLVETPFSSFDEEMYQVKGVYKLTFDSNQEPSQLKDQLVYLTFEGVMVSCDITLNGVNLGHFNYGYLPFRVDISKVIKEKGNELTVIVDGKEDKEMPPWGGVVDYLSFAGIYREVYIEYFDPVDFLDVKIDTKHTGEITLYPEIRNVNNETLHVYYEVVDLKTGESKGTLHDTRGKIDDIIPWTAENPYLYKLVACIDSDSFALSKEYVFGFRTVEVKGDKLLINAAETRLIGLNRHETYPYLGAAATRYLQYDDVKILKSLGINYVRCSHYPPSKHFLDACDELGLYVIDETPGWQYIGKDEKWRNKHIDNIKRMINRDFNHPSVIIWSTRINESNDDDDLYLKTQELVKSLDTSRPNSGTRNFANSHDIEDIYAYNDFSHNGKNKGVVAKKKITKTTKPYLITECNGHMFPTKISDTPEKQLDFTARHMRVINDALERDDNIGISPWCMHDYYTHKEFGSGDKICYHGVLDVYRNPKPVAYFYKSQNDKEQLTYPTFNFNVGDIPEAHLIPFYVLSNASYIDFYKGDNLIKRFYPLKDEYPKLPHPSFKIDEFIAANFLDKYPYVSEKKANKLRKILNYAAIYGLTELPLNYLLTVGLTMQRYKWKYDDLVNLWYDNVASWGSESSSYRLVSYDKDGNVIDTIPLAPTKNYHYDLKLDKDTLVNDVTYDTTKLIITKLDNNNLRQRYDVTPVVIKTEGPIRISGPDVQNLHGGALTIYIHSLSHNGLGKVSITIENHTYQYDINVIKKGAK
jgi:beta-galactosidase